MFCQCETEPSTLFRYGLWPATAEKPQTAYSVSMECQVSVVGFCNAMHWKTSLCLSENGEMVIQLDANFGLVRKASSGVSVGEPLHGARMFMRDQDIQTYLQGNCDSSVPHEIKYSTWRLEGFGTTDGEGMERLWSYLRRFSRMTKETTPSHRLDLLTDGLLNYGRRKSTDIGVVNKSKREYVLLLLHRNNICLKRTAVDTLNRKDRTLEESQMLHQEMRAVLNYLHLQHDLAKKAVENYHQPGLRSALIHHCKQLEKRFNLDTDMFSQCMDLPQSEVLELDEYEEEEEEDLRWG
ncbi:hypothetical protein SKAU_G00288120 [Synaphobranchus kaupii]|uniref:Uncharacterized protein n=1 Tax=Synaphobranchus kaupii TaxID=118154 RepID=A0A9Q1ET55_SYNKA|nr:hypothetical protein SKAU_G00288120 [Synaphobranchus kaupii]